MLGSLSLLVLTFFLLQVLSRCESFALPGQQRGTGSNVWKKTVATDLTSRQPFQSGSLEPSRSLVSISAVVASTVPREDRGILRSALGWYNNLLVKYPHPTKMISSAMVAGLGDVLIQVWTQRMAGAATIALDLRRLFVFMTVAGFYIAPATHYWFNYLDAMPFARGLGKWARSFVMIAVDQTVGALVISAAFFYAFELVSEAMLYSAPFPLASLNLL